jgi:glycosyltransferase involved in cell wall biosynthesis
LRVGYVAYEPAITSPGDRRRFPYYARKRGIDFEVADISKDYDLVVVTPRSDLLGWSRYRPGQAKLIFDMVDSYLEIPRTNAKALLRGPAKFAAGESSTPFFSYRRAIERVLERADAGTSATPEQAAAMSRFCSNVHPILDFEMETVQHVKEDYSAATPFKIVWEGLGENMHWFSLIREPLHEVARQRPLELHLVTQPTYRQFMQRFWTRDTAKMAAQIFENVQLHQWTVDAVSQVATQCDLAAIPLSLEEPFARGKPESKLIIFWSIGLPVITSATPAYIRVMSAAGQDNYCSSTGEWTRKLSRLVEDDAAREQAGRGGRAYAQREYSEDRLMARWDRVFDSLGITFGGS